MRERECVCERERESVCVSERERVLSDVWDIGLTIETV